MCDKKNFQVLLKSPIYTLLIARMDPSRSVSWNAFNGFIQEKKKNLEMDPSQKTVTLKWILLQKSAALK